MLDYRLQGTVYVIKLRGHLFFGNCEQLRLHIREVLAGMPGLKFALLDTSEMVGVDFSARERLARICKVRVVKALWVGGVYVRPINQKVCISHLNPPQYINHTPHIAQSVTGRRVHIVWAGLKPRLRDKLALGGVFDAPPLPPGGASLAKRGSSNMNLGGVRASSPTHKQMQQQQQQSEGGGPGSSSNFRFHHFATDLNKGALSKESRLGRLSGVCPPARSRRAVHNPLRHHPNNYSLYILRGRCARVAGRAGPGRPVTAGTYACMHIQA